MKLEPLGSRVIVKRVTEDNLKGIIVPKDSNQKNYKGEVVAAGPDADWVQVGDKVLFGQFSGFELKKKSPFLPDEYDDHLMMDCEDILAKIQEDK